MKQMLNLFQPGQLPEPSTFNTFGRIFSANVFDSIPFLSAVLSMLVPLLPEARTDGIKRAIAGGKVHNTLILKLFSYLKD